MFLKSISRSQFSQDYINFYFVFDLPIVIICVILNIFHLIAVLLGPVYRETKGWASNLFTKFKICTSLATTFSVF